MSVMQLVLASNNQGKLDELQYLFAPLGVELIAQGTLGVPESPEPFRTFIENALAKARNAAHHTGLPALADDAGLCVHAFGGLPGVDTAFYATQFGYPKGDDNNVSALLEQMQGIQDRRAALVSTLVRQRSKASPRGASAPASTYKPKRPSAREHRERAATELTPWERQYRGLEETLGADLCGLSGLVLALDR